MPTGVHTVTVEAITQIVDVYDLSVGAEYTDALGVSITANEESWGRTGIVIYAEEDNHIVYTVVGYGYTAIFPLGSSYWDGSDWVLTPVYNQFTLVKVPVLVTPTPTSTPTPLNTVHLPIIMGFKSSECLESVPFEPFYWQQENAVVACSTGVPTPINGVSAVAIDGGWYNWRYPGIMPGSWLTSGEVFTGEHLQLDAINGPIGVYAYSVPAEGCWVYSIIGGGYATTQIPVTAAVLWFNHTVGAWQNTAAWTDHTIICVQD